MPRFIAIFSSNPFHTLAVAQILSPRIGICPPDGLLLEVAARYERQTLKRLLQETETTGQLKTGIASTRIAALFAAKTRSGTVVPPGKERDFLASLPVSLLSLITQEADRKLLLTFFQWGVRTLGELAALPEGELAARLGQAGLRLQKMARGEDTELFQSYVEGPHFEESQELEWTLDSLEPLTFILGGILERLCARLQSYGLAADSLQLVLRLDNHTSYKRTLRLAFPMRDPKVLLSLLRLDLQSHPPNSAIVGVLLQAIPAPPRVIQHSLLEPPVPSPEKLSRTLGRLSVLLGENNIGSPILLDTHRPDAIAVEPWPLEQKSQRASRVEQKSNRAKEPTRFARRTKEQKNRRAEEQREDIRNSAFDIRRSTFDIRHSPRLSLRRFRPPKATSIRSDQIVVCAGPWRSSGDWWTGTSHKWSRDEWDVEVLDGSICRIYWDHRKKTWFLEGIYD
ncbi:hypothetical protein MYX84_08255 [Acidobacteria bacterium AH-259-O06]|nr:hypothetical protein [Acidobacteria bacterium AH-259-O06]